MDLNEYGGACRCLLRARENEGHPGMSDAAFIQRFLPAHPEWTRRAGAAEFDVICDIAKELGLAEHIEIFRDYNRVLAEYRAGRTVLVSTERVPELRETGLVALRFVALLVDINVDQFELWCPYPSGQSENLPPAPRVWWDRWLATGIVLERAPNGAVMRPAAKVET